MKQLLHFALSAFLASILTGCSGQTKPEGQNQQTPANNGKPVGGGCDGCEIMFAGMPALIKPVDTSAGWTEKGQKLLVKGTVYKIDGKTPAPEIIVYYWHTDSKGYYSPKEGMKEEARRHGHIRGWVKTDGEGKYAIYTSKPAPYPNSDIPAHIHITIKEPRITNAYYIDELIFDDDQLLTAEKRKALENRGGSGIVKARVSDNLQIAEHNIILGLHIPNYPDKGQE